MFRLIVVVVACLATSVWGYSSGAPDSVCHSGLAPKHNYHNKTDVVESTAPVPYSFAGEASVKTGQKYSLKLHGDEFAGFVIQATSDNKPIGNFIIENPQYMQHLKCSGEQSTVTHKKIPTPINSIQVSWESPANFKGKVLFVATVAKNHDIYWVGKVRKEIEVV